MQVTVQVSSVTDGFPRQWTFGNNIRSRLPHK